MGTDMEEIKGKERGEFVQNACIKFSRNLEIFVKLQ